MTQTSILHSLLIGTTGSPNWKCPAIKSGDFHNIELSTPDCRSGNAYLIYCITKNVYWRRISSGGHSLVRARKSDFDTELIMAI